MTMVKFCGLSRPEDIAVANELLPDMVGFVFARASRRAVTGEVAQKLGRALAPSIRRVGVFMEVKMPEIAEMVKTGVIDTVQLHAPCPFEVSEAQISELRRATKGTELQIIRAFGVSDTTLLHEAERTSADLVLLDNPRGGSGEAFEHALLEGFTRPYILSGGLTPENIAPLLERWRPWGVDVSSGIEVAGQKNRDKMIAFLKAVRMFDGEGIGR